MWSIQLNWNGAWVTLATGFESRGDAEWATAVWKQSHNIRSDSPFRTLNESPDAPLPGESDFQDSFNAMQSAIAALPKTEVFPMDAIVRPAAELCHEHGLPKDECACPSEFAAAAAELGGES